jgi:DNA polymerase-3 subunit epsilon
MAKYAVIDVETTGLNPKNERLTEIAIILLEGKKIVDEYTTLINPDKKIPYRITQLTGINNQMVYNAPRFYEVAKQIVEMTEDCVFVAHNASFDYRFIQAEFARYGYDYQKKLLDTVKLSRKLLPGFRSYNLGKLTQQLGIKISARHRAFGDAKATAELFIRLLGINPNLSQLNTRGLHSHLKQEQIEAVPHKTGVYYFFDKDDTLIYIGKSNDIHSRVLSHLSNTSTKKATEMRERIARIDFQLCGSELIALLMESNEIKTHMPLYNRAQRRTAYIWGLYDYKDEDDYQCLQILKANKNEAIPIRVFKTKKSAVSALRVLTEEYQLCQKLNGLYQSSGACFHYSIHQCKGACLQKEPSEEYNARVEKLKNRFQYQKDNLLIIDTGRHESEKSLVLIEGGVYKGFGYIDVSELDQPIEIVKSFIKYFPNNKDVTTIIQSYLRQNKAEAIVDF